MAVQTGLVSIQDLAALGSTSVGTRRQEGAGEGLWRKGMRRNGPEGRELDSWMFLSRQSKASKEHQMYKLVAWQKIVCSTLGIALSGWRNETS